MSETDPPAHNTLSNLDDNTVVLTQAGHQTLASINQYHQNIDDFTVTQHKAGKKSFVLVDMTNITGHDPEVRDEGRRQMDGDYDAMALFGSSTAIRMIVNWLIQSTGKGEKIRFFASRDEAVAWLNGHLT